MIRRTLRLGVTAGLLAGAAYAAVRALRGGPVPAFDADEGFRHPPPVGRASEPAPLPTPQPVPVPDPSPDPGTEPVPPPVPSPEPLPSPEPAPSPVPEPSPVPSPDPSPLPGPDPSPLPGPAPAAPGEPMPTPPDEPRPAPQGEPMPAPQGEPMPAPQEEPMPAPQGDGARPVRRRARPIVVRRMAQPADASAEDTVGAAPEATASDRPWVDPVEGACPASHVVKAKLRSGIYHVPGMLNYARTVPDRCYVDVPAAEADGLRPAKR